MTKKSYVTKYTIITLGRDVDKNGEITPPYLTDDAVNLFDSKAKAYEAAYCAADEEAEELNDGADEGISFGVVEDEDVIITNYYYDDNTEWVTKRVIKEAVYETD